MIKNKIFKQGIGIAKKAKKQEGIIGVVMQITNLWIKTHGSVSCGLRIWRARVYQHEEQCTSFLACL